MVAVTVAGAETLTGLGNFMGAYAISDTSAAILAAATTGAVTGATEVSLTDPMVAVTVAGAETLTGLGNFMGAYAISDTSAAILAASGSSTITGATEVSLVDPAVGVTVADAEALTGLSNFAGTYALTDSLANLEAQSAQPIVAGASSYSLTDAAGNLGIVSGEQQTLVQGATNASDFTFTTVGITATTNQINEGSPIGFNVTLSAAQTSDVTVVLTLQAGDGTAPNAGTNETNVNDFGSGVFNPVTIVIPAGETLVSYIYSPLDDGIVEFPENFSVNLVVLGTSVNISTPTLVALDGTAGPSDTFFLTSSPDTQSGFANYVANQVYNPGGTNLVNSLQDTDNLTGTGAGSVLQASIGNPNDNGGFVITPKLTDIETLNFDFVSNGDFEIGLQDTTGTQNVNITSISNAQRQTIKEINGTQVETIGVFNTNDDAAASFLYRNNTLSGESDAVTINLNNAGLNRSFQGAGFAAFEVMAQDAVGGALQNQLEQITINSGVGDTPGANSIATFDTGVDSFDNPVNGFRPQTIDINTVVNGDIAIGTLRWLGNRIETFAADGFNLGGVDSTRTFVGFGGSGFVSTSRIKTINLAGEGSVLLANVGDPYGGTAFRDAFTLDATALTGDLNAGIANSSDNTASQFLGGEGRNRFYVANKDVKARVSGGANETDVLTVQSEFSVEVKPQNSSTGIEYYNLVSAESFFAPANFDVLLPSSAPTQVSINNQSGFATNYTIGNLGTETLVSVRSQSSVRNNLLLDLLDDAGDDDTIALEAGHATNDLLESSAFSWTNNAPVISVTDLGTAENLVFTANSGVTELILETGDFQKKLTVKSAPEVDYKAPLTVSSIGATTYDGSEYNGNQTLVFGLDKAHTITTGAGSDSIDLRVVTLGGSFGAPGGGTLGSTLRNTSIDGGEGVNKVILSANLADPRNVDNIDPTYDQYFRNWSNIQILELTQPLNAPSTTNKPKDFTDAGADSQPNVAPNQPGGRVNLNNFANAAGINQIILADGISQTVAAWSQYNQQLLTIDLMPNGGANGQLTVNNSSLADVTINKDLQSFNDPSLILVQSTGRSVENVFTINYTLNPFNNEIIDGNTLQVEQGSLDNINLLLNENNTPFVGGEVITITADDSWVAAGQSLIVDANALRSNGTSFLTIDFSGETDGNVSVTVEAALANGFSQTLFGGAGDDDLKGGDLVDRIEGRGGNDTIDGGGGNDILFGGTGNDLLTGGSGSNTFTFESTAAFNGNDTLTDFTAGNAGDRLDFSLFNTTGITANFLGTLTNAFASATAQDQVRVVGSQALVSNSTVLTAGDFTNGVGNSVFADFNAVAKSIVVTLGATDGAVYFIDSTLAGLDFRVDAGDIRKVATLTGVNSSSVFTGPNIIV
jgi:hypothetical protein